MTALESGPDVRDPAVREGARETSASDLEVPGRRPRHPVRDVVGAYVALTKPRIIELLLVTTIPVMFLAAGGVPPLVPVVMTLVGGLLAAGSANALNCVFDRDIDERMRRTRRRPLPRHAVGPYAALVFAVTLGVLATLWLGFFVNWLAAGLALAANVFYVCVYTLLLKRRTTQNVVWGGLCGCVPVLVGWVAIQGSLAWPPVALFCVVFFWTPPHTWALALRYREDYAAGGVPMLPVVVGERRTTVQIVAYSWVTVAVSLALWPMASTGWLYPVAATVLGAGLVTGAHLLWSRARRGLAGAALRPMRFFHATNLYLALLFVAVALDPVLTH